MLMTRVLAALVFTPAMLAVIWFGGAGLAAACACIAALMLYEYLEMTLGSGDLRLKVIAYVLGAGLLGIILHWLPAWLGPLWLPVATLLVFTTVLTQPQPLSTSTQRASLVLLGVVYCTGLIPYLARLRNLSVDGQGFCLMALLCTWGADTGAYFTGRVFGRRKLYPTISPAKTVEGGIGGALWALVISVAVRAVFGMQVTVPHALALGAVAACFGLWGDLCESMIKRSVGAKDSSRLIPGHGGVLDRFDAVMFVAPAYYLYIAFFLRNRDFP